MLRRSAKVRVAELVAARIGLRGALFITAICALPPMVMAQAMSPSVVTSVTSASCRSRLTGSRLSVNWYVAPAAAATVPRGTLLLGWPYLEFDPAADTLEVRDSTSVGLIVSGVGRPIVIPQPLPGLLLANPKVRGVGRGSVDVVFSANPARPLAQERRDSIVMWGARLRDGTWRDVTRIIAVPKRSLEHRQIVGDAASYRGEMVAGVIEREDEFSPSYVTLIRGGAAAWRVERALPSLGHPTYLDLAVYRDTLWMAVAAQASVGNSPLPVFGIWLSHLGTSGWVPPRLVAAGSGRTMREPRLLGSAAGLVVVWLDGEPPSASLRWRGAATTGDTTIRERLTTSFLSRGIESHTHLLSTAVDDTTAQVLELTPQGARVVAELPTVAAIAPLILGAMERPVVIGPQLAGRPVAVPLWLSSFDLRCGFPSATKKR